VRRRVEHHISLVGKRFQEQVFEKLWKSITNRIAAILEATSGDTK